MKSIPADLAWLNLPNLPTPAKVLFSGYLLAIGLGLAMAGLQIMLAHGMADGKPGLSLNDIVYSYYCNRSGSKLESMLHGPMKQMGTPEARIDIIEWARKGAPEAEWEPHFKGVFNGYCVRCHSTIPNIPDFTKYESVKKMAEINEGASIQTLTRSSHITCLASALFSFLWG